jgi:hypothetical protein
MRALRTIRILTVLTTLTTLASCAPYGRGGQSQADVSVRWDSGPLDRDYRRQRADMDARHSQEVASPRYGESSDSRQTRHDAENRSLEVRYEQGKTAHAQRMPD